MSSTIIIKRCENGWSAWNNDKAIAESPCKPCIISLMKNLTKNSKKYTSIFVVADNGEILEEMKTGVKNAGNN